MIKTIFTSAFALAFAFGGILVAQDKKQDKELQQINAALPSKPTVKPSKTHKILEIGRASCRERV